MLILDFDGVMMNSLNEVVITSFNALTSDTLTSHADLPDGYASHFLKNRFHVQPAADFIPFARWCLNQAGSSSSSQQLQREDFLRMLSEEKEPAEERRKRFFAARNRLVNVDKKGWIALNQPFQPLWDTLREQRARFVILTNKNRKAVLDLSTHYGLELEEDSIYSAEKGFSKITNLENIAQRYQDGDYFVIDDSINNLAELQQAFQGRLNLQLGFASWGYVGPGDSSEAVERGFTVFAQEDLINLVRG